MFKWLKELIEKIKSLGEWLKKKFPNNHVLYTEIDKLEKNVEEIEKQQEALLENDDEIAVEFTKLNEALITMIDKNVDMIQKGDLTEDAILARLRTINEYCDEVRQQRNDYNDRLKNCTFDIKDGLNNIFGNTDSYQIIDRDGTYIAANGKCTKIEFKHKGDNYICSFEKVKDIDEILTDEEEIEDVSYEEVEKLIRKQGVAYALENDEHLKELKNDVILSSDMLKTATEMAELIRRGEGQIGKMTYSATEKGLTLTKNYETVTITPKNDRIIIKAGTGTANREVMTIRKDANGVKFIQKGDYDFREFADNPTFISAIAQFSGTLSTEIEEKFQLIRDTGNIKKAIDVSEGNKDKVLEMANRITTEWNRANSGGYVLKTIAGTGELQACILHGAKGDFNIRFEEENGNVICGIEYNGKTILKNGHPTEEFNRAKRNKDVQACVNIVNSIIKPNDMTKE